MASLYLFASVFWFQALWGQDCLFSMTVPTTATSSLGVVQFCSSRNEADPVPCSRCLFRLPLPFYLHVLHVCSFLGLDGSVGKKCACQRDLGKDLVLWPQKAFCCGSRTLREGHRRVPSHTNVSPNTYVSCSQSTLAADSSW